MRHFENEGEAQNYLGMHQWNIEIKEERIHIWNREVSHLFDHEAHGLELDYTRETVRKGTGAPHPQVTFTLTRSA